MMITPAIELAKLAIAYENAHAVYFPAAATEMAAFASQVMADAGVRYWISPSGSSITCTKCRMTSHNRNDVRERYCGNCHVSLDDLTPEAHRRIHERLHESFDSLLADFLVHNSGKLPSNTTIFELMEWSHRQTIEPQSFPAVNLGR